MVLIIGLLTTVATVLFVVMVLAVVMSHRSRCKTNTPSGPLVVELIWSVIPWVIVVAAGTPAVVRIIK